ncbi:hypothetical protein F5Y16DRAFT_286708 [Xylariaceae sp. FL0255]|nr:hypothetical protein F5Y16DRAFT_286708 [Xylariaceae sp. FL0255]
MATRPLSPKRRHILSSINPEEPLPAPNNATGDIIRDKKADTPPSPSPPPLEKQNQDTEQEPTEEARRERKTSKFRFKSKHSSSSHRSSRHRERDYDDKDAVPHDPSSSSRRHRSHRHRHHHHHRHRQRRHSRSRSPVHDHQRSPTPPNPYAPPPLDAEAAFRESLFDAMADDEGAAYWESVYGQPIHVYPQSQPSGPDGELERMDDEEYAAYVRQKMWEKTHQGLLEERERRKKAAREKTEKREEAERLTREMERSLRKGEERRRKKGWRERFGEYSHAWENWDGSLLGLSWPVKSGKREDAKDPEAVRDFYVLGIDAAEVGEREFVARLKDERVRWHPDKIQQRLGGNVDVAVMRDVTAVFQIIDRLWSDTRSRATGAK